MLVTVELLCFVGTSLTMHAGRNNPFQGDAYHTKYYGKDNGVNEGKSMSCSHSSCLF